MIDGYKMVRQVFADDGFVVEDDAGVQYYMEADEIFGPLDDTGRAYIATLPSGDTLKVTFDPTEADQRRSMQTPRTFSSPLGPRRHRESQQ